MATQKPTLSGFLTEFLLRLLNEQDVQGRARVIAEQTAELFGGCGVAVYRLERERNRWALLAELGEVAAESYVEAGEGTLGRAERERRALVVPAGNLRREDYAHLGVRRTLASIAYLPQWRGDELIGAIEVVSFDRGLREADLEAAGPLAEYAAIALAAALAYETERNAHYDSITRLTQLYDLERTFNSTLDMSKLMPIITAKIAEVLSVDAVHLWMVQDDDLLLLSTHGTDATVRSGQTQAAGEGIAAEVSDSGQSVRIVDVNDARLAKRNGELNPPPARSVIAAPVVAQGFMVGVLEAVNRADGAPFTDDDLFFLDTISQTAASALHNASLLEAERKVEILETLVEVSREITSTLNLDRVLQVVVNGPQRIMEYDRAAIAMDRMGKLQIRAISGKAEVVAAEPSVKLLHEVLEFCATSDEETYVVARNGAVKTDDEEIRARFTRYFQQTGVRAWYCLPLTDDQGRLGVLSFESKNPDFLTEAHLELVKVLAAQATVSIRNASMYTETPFIGVLEPLQKKKRQFMRMSRERRAATIATAAAALLFLVFVPVPMRVTGTALVAPLRKAEVQAPFDAVVRRVLVHEGEAVHRDTVLAELDDWEYRSAVGAAEAKREEALAKMNRALASNDGAEAGTQRVEAEYWTSELSRARERLERTRLRSPIDGVVATPHIEDQAGRKLQVGDLFAEVVDSSHASVDVAVDQQDLQLLRAGETAALKLDGFPTRKFHGVVNVVAPVAAAQGDERVFMARVDVENSDGTIRSGMQGRGKVSAGWRPAGYVMFRGVGMWAWTKLWTWFGW